MTAGPVLLQAAASNVSSMAGSGGHVGPAATADVLSTSFEGAAAAAAGVEVDDDSPFKMSLSAEIGWTLLFRCVTKHFGIEKDPSLQHIFPKNTSNLKQKCKQFLMAYSGSIMLFD